MAKASVIRKRLNGSNDVFLNFGVPIELKQQLQQIADQQERPLSWLARKALRQFIEREKTNVEA